MDAKNRMAKNKKLNERFITNKKVSEVNNEKKNEEKFLHTAVTQLENLKSFLIQIECKKKKVSCAIST